MFGDIFYFVVGLILIWVALIVVVFIIMELLPIFKLFGRFLIFSSQKILYLMSKIFKGFKKKLIKADEALSRSGNKFEVKINSIISKDKKNKAKRYFNSKFLLIYLLIVALILIWLNPYSKVRSKDLVMPSVTEYFSDDVTNSTYYINSSKTDYINSTDSTDDVNYIYDDEYIDVSHLNTLKNEEIKMIYDDICAKDKETLNDIEKGNIEIIKYYGKIAEQSYDFEYASSFNVARENKYEINLEYKLHKEYVTESYLKTLSRYDVYVMRNEIYARHGYAFNYVDLQELFKKQSWYSPIENFDERVFNDIEKANIAIILGHEKKMGWQ